MSKTEMGTISNKIRKMLMAEEIINNSKKGTQRRSSKR